MLTSIVMLDRTQSINQKEMSMTLCPIALVAGCKKCPAFSVCPLKGVIGDYLKQEESQPPPQAKDKNNK